MDYNIGVDIGGTKIAAGIVQRDGTIIHQVKVPTPKLGREAILQVLKEVIVELTLFANKKSITLGGIGIGTAGQVHVQEAKILSGTSNIRNWGGIHLREEIKAYSELPVYVDNDVNVLTLAEQYFGAAKGYQEVICLALGTGVGGGVLTKGSLIHGTWGGATELGHMSVDMNGELCNCGLPGCLETFASGTWIARRMSKLLTEHGEEHIDVASITGEEVFRFYKEGHPLAKEVVQQMIQGLSIGIINLIHMFNPQIVVLGGGVMANEDWIIYLLQENLKHKGLRALVNGVELKSAELQNESGLIGASIQPWLYSTNKFSIENVQ
ncbi:ROK family protein [Sutcliffiella sp. NC1]|uniref:ROK family protein n=1 Tax=Sutcliffiella sp. NC1 TaxID=3004096 RepID=UPI0022DDAEA5|nr:ROK family protein [Sutcliffiella sp. NC1]WBL16652.1 ROK family protein [Sutcliffiella sp. NC1]